MLVYFFSSRVKEDAILNLYSCHHLNAKKEKKTFRFELTVPEGARTKNIA